MFAPLLPRARLLGAGLGAELKTQLFAGPSGRQTQVRTATKRGGGSSKNGRDSESKRLGVKKFTNQYVLPGQILVRQRGTAIHAGQHVGVGTDHTLFAREPGFVKFYTAATAFPHAEAGGARTGAQAAAALLRAAAPSPPVAKPRGVRQYIGIVASRDEALPRDEAAHGRSRRFWGTPLEPAA